MNAMKRTLNTTINRSKNEKNSERCTHSHGYTLTTPSGNTIRRIVERDDYRRSLVTNCVTYFNSSLIDSNVYAFDALSRPTARTTGTTGISPVDSTFAYNNRSEVVSAAIGTNHFTHAYDDIGNHLLFGDNAATNTFAHNQLNQMVGRVAPSAPPTSFTYTPDGGLASDGTWSYAYDAEDQLLSVTSSSLTNGAIRVLNTYDYRRRRTSKTVQRLYSTIPPPPAPPIGVEEWQTLETRTFVYDDWNLIHETIYAIEGSITNIAEVQYFWGLDLSDTLQGAGGVGGLLAVSRNGQFYFPTFDNNGNVTKCIDESGNVVAAYEYDDFGRYISQTGSLADFFRHRFSTKYYDPETGLYYYGYRFYSPDCRIWLNRDPIGELGGVNLYVICRNASSIYYDDIGGQIASPFTFVGDPRTQNGHSGAYVGLWYPAAGIGSLYYEVNMSVKWGQCDDCCEKPDGADYTFDKQLAFWENDNSRAEDKSGNVNAYINLVNTDPHGGNGFNGYLPNGIQSYRLIEDPNLSLGASCTWGVITVRMKWYELAQKGPAHPTPESTGGSIIWHEFLEKESRSSMIPPQVYTIVKSGVQRFEIKWSCKDVKASVSSDPIIKNGPQRKKWR